VNVAQGRGASVGIVRTPYPTSSARSPTKGRSGTGSGSNPGSGAPGQPTPTPSAPNWGRVAAVGALVAAVGVGAVLLVPGADDWVLRWWRKGG